MDLIRNLFFYLLIAFGNRIPKVGIDLESAFLLFWFISSCLELSEAILAQSCPILVPFGAAMTAAFAAPLPAALAEPPAPPDGHDGAGEGL